MSQHDLNITQADADAGVDYRAAVNAALQALGSNSSGATAPVTTYAYQFWADTTTKMMKQRDATNSYWMSLWPLSNAVIKKHITTINSPYTAPSTIIFLTVGCTTGNIVINLPQGSSFPKNQRLIVRRIDADTHFKVTLNTFDPGGGGLADSFFDGDLQTKLIPIESQVELIPGEDSTYWYTI